MFAAFSAGANQGQERFCMAIRLNTSFLAVGERALLTAIVRRLPPWTTPNHLTALGLLGAVVTAASFVFCHWSWVVLPLVVFGLFLQLVRQFARWVSGALSGDRAAPLWFLSGSFQRSHRADPHRYWLRRFALFYDVLRLVRPFTLSSHEFIHLPQGGDPRLA